MKRLLSVWSVWVASSLMINRCKAADDVLPAPTALTYQWTDPFTLSASWRWEKPAEIQGHYTVFYELQVVNVDAGDKPLRSMRTKSQHYTCSILSEEMGSIGQWQLSIQVHCIHSSGTLRSRTKSITVNAIKPRDDLVKDFKCLIDEDKMRCSWIPTDQSVNMTVSYRYCGTSAEDIRSLKNCEQYHSFGGRNSCLMRTDPRQREVCVLVESDAKLKTFKPDLVITVPKVSIAEDGDHLNLSWTPPGVGGGCGWDYEVCYSECNRVQPCQIYKGTTGRRVHGPLRVLYDKHCLYQFEFKVSTDRLCTAVRSDGSGFITYGNSRPVANPLMSTIGVAVVLSLSLSASVILSAYCCRRHSAVLCPIIPDPSAIFKDMMNGSKESRSAAGQYTYTPQIEETCRITVVPRTVFPEMPDTPYEKLKMSKKEEQIVRMES